MVVTVEVYITSDCVATVEVYISSVCIATVDVYNSNICVYISNVTVATAVYKCLHLATCYSTV